MKTRGWLSAVLMAVAVLLISITAYAAASSVEIRTEEGIGNYLVDDKGMTLYLFLKDTPGQSACMGPCVEKWPLFHVEKIVVPDGVRAEDFASITRSDGKMQTTYKGLPLYYFFKDTNPGDINGNGVNNVWAVAKP